MGRDSYDDMQSPSDRGRRGGGKGKVGILALFCVLIFLVFLIGFMLFASPKDESSSSSGEKVQSVVRNVSEKSSGDEKKEEKSETAVQEVKVEPQVVQISAEEPKPAVQMQNNTTAARDVVQAREESSSSRIRYTEHIVQSGEDLTKIAEQYGLKVQTLISVNQIRNVAGITEGVKLSIPDRDGQLYTVQNGDMLSTIARRFNPDMGWKELQELNGLKTENIRVGQKLFIPDAIQAGPGVVTASAISFKQPVKGSITAAFGQLVDGKPLGGVYITGPAGSAVFASSKGAVIDAGNDPELGRFVTIQHEDGYKTTYAYLERVEVKVGTELDNDTVIGSIGLSSGKTTEPTLFFIIEQSGIALDPSLFF